MIGLSGNFLDSLKSFYITGEYDLILLEKPIKIDLPTLSYQNLLKSKNKKKIISFCSQKQLDNKKIVFVFFGEKPQELIEELSKNNELTIIYYEKEKTQNKTTKQINLILCSGIRSIYSVLLSPNIKHIGCNNINSMTKLIYDNDISYWKTFNELLYIGENKFQVAQFVQIYNVLYGFFPDFYKFYSFLSVVYDYSGCLQLMTEINPGLDLSKFFTIQMINKSFQTKKKKLAEYIRVFRKNLPNEVYEEIKEQIKRLSKKKKPTVFLSKKIANWRLLPLQNETKWTLPVDLFFDEKSFINILETCHYYVQNIVISYELFAVINKKLSGFKLNIMTESDYFLTHKPIFEKTNLIQTNRAPWQVVTKLPFSQAFSQYDIEELKHLQNDNVFFNNYLYCLWRQAIKEYILHEKTLQSVQCIIDKYSVFFDLSHPLLSLESILSGSIKGQSLQLNYNNIEFVFSYDFSVLEKDKICFYKLGMPFFQSSPGKELASVLFLINTMDKYISYDTSAKLLVWTGRNWKENIITPTELYLNVCKRKTEVNK